MRDAQETWHSLPGGHVDETWSFLVCNYGGMNHAHKSKRSLLEMVSLSYAHCLAYSTAKAKGISFGSFSRQPFTSLESDER